MKIGIIGSGNMGRSLGILWAEQGHQVFFGSRDAEKGKAVAEFAELGTQGGSNDQAVAFEEIGFLPIDTGILRNARLVEGLGDFIRLIIIGQEQGAYATISVNILPAAQEQRLGGRQASSLK